MTLETLAERQTPHWSGGIKPLYSLLSIFACSAVTPQTPKRIISTLISASSLFCFPGSWDCLVRVWDLSAMKLCIGDSGWSGWKLHMDELLCQMDHDAPVNCVALHPKEELLASATTDGFVSVWLLKKDCSILKVKGRYSEGKIQIF